MTVQFSTYDDLSSFTNSSLRSPAVSFTVLHVNIRSIRKYWDEFCALVNNEDSVFDAYVLTEINIPGASADIFSLPEHESYFFTRENGRGGGIAVFINHTWSATVLPISFAHAESVVLSVENSNFSISLFAVYRPPSNNVRCFIDELETALSAVNPVSQLCLIGDLNIDILTPTKSVVCDYLNVLSKFALESVIEAPTREEFLGGKFVSSCLDHINIRTLNASYRAAVVTQKLADHYIIVCEIVVAAANQVSSTESRRISVFDKKSFDRLVVDYDWVGFMREADNITAYPKFIQVFASFYASSKKEILIKQRRLDRRWLTADILAAIKVKKDLWYRCRRSRGNIELQTEFKIARNQVNALIRSARRRHYRSRFSEARGNSAKTWSLANEIRGSTNPRLEDNSILSKFSSPAEVVVNNFNDFFARTSGVIRDETKAQNTLRDSIIESAFLNPIDESQLHYLLFSLKPNKAPGKDGIRIIDLHRNFNTLKNVLLFLLNGILDSGIFPAELKTAIVKPLFKGGNHSRVENYRPISILSCISQLIEKHLFDTITSFFDRNNIISPSQYGFIAGRGTQPLLEEFSDNLFLSFERNLFSCGLFLDVAKAFDSISHNILCEKLHKMGIRGPLLDLIRSYLQERTQVVHLGGFTSRSVPLRAGVPQGSIISPLLFNVYTNDLWKVVKECKIFQYADDTVLLSSHITYTGAVCALQRDVMQVADWYKNNLIEINSAKTKLVCFRNPLKHVSLACPLYLHSATCVNCYCMPIEYVSSVKYLGIIFDSDMSWNGHLAYICKRLRSASCCLYNIKIFLPVSVRKMLAHALAYSVLRYGVTLFWHCSSFWRSRVDSILKNILKSVSYDLNCPPNTNYFSLLEMPSFQTLFRNTVVLRHYWRSDYMERKTYSRPLRQNERYKIPFFVTRYGRSTRDFYVPQIFNDLPENAFNINTISKLKKELLNIT